MMHTQVIYDESNTEKQDRSFWSRRKRNLFSAAFAVLLIGVCTVVFLTVKHRQAAVEPIILPDQFAVMGGVPYYVKDGILYRSAEDGWLPVEEYGEVRLIEDDETVSGLDAEGRLFYEYDLDPDPEGEYINLSYGITLHMGRKLAEMNEQYAFADIDRGFPHYALIALLEDGTVLFPIADDYVEYQMDETPARLSGGFALTGEGNVYYLRVKTVVKAPEQITEPTADLLYSGGDIVTIDGYWPTSECLGLKTDGTVVSWSMMSNFDPLPVSDWTNMAAAVQGNHFAVGLTSRGEVLYASNSRENQTKMQEALSEWKDVVAITVYYMEVYALKADGSWVSMEISLK